MPSPPSEDDDENNNGSPVPIGSIVAIRIKNAVPLSPKLKILSSAITHMTLFASTAISLNVVIPSAAYVTEYSFSPVDAILEISLASAT